jgi:di/tricarboxylate transporter
MTLHQSEAFLIVTSMLGLFAWGRLRHDIVALLALAAGLLTGVVPAGQAFLGFANPVIIIIASVLVLSRAIAISGVIELAMRGSLRPASFYVSADRGPDGVRCNPSPPS